MNKIKILLIDDDIDLSASARLFLESRDYEVQTAINTRAGLIALKESEPDLIILDIMMDTNLEGFNFLNDLKADSQMKHIPVIVNTSMAKAIGVNMRNAIEDVETMPFTKFIDKSGDLEELLKAVEELLPEMN